MASASVRREAVAWAAAVGVVSASVLAAAAVGPSGGGLALGIAGLSAGATDAIQQLGDRLPASYALAAGMVAAFNPCGFALLPTYLGLYLGSVAGPGQQRVSVRAVWRALLVSGVVTSSFVVLFGVVGLVLSTAAFAVAGTFPWLSLAAGVALVVVGSRTLAGSPLYLATPERLADRPGSVAGRVDLLGYGAYGVAFALSSLGCALPLFLSVVGTALVADGVLGGLRQLVLYALGMGLAVGTLTVGTALLGGTLLPRVRRVGRRFGALGGLLLVATGAYVVFYWLSVGGLLWG